MARRVSSILLKSSRACILQAPRSDDIRGSDGSTGLKGFLDESVEYALGEWRVRESRY